MEKEERSAGIKILDFLCNGATVEGLMFYGLKLHISESESNSDRIKGQIYINIESDFCIFDTMPKEIPLHDDLPKLNLVESSKLLCELRLKKIKDISLSKKSPHLFLTFETGEVLFIWGHHDKYESWQVGVIDTSMDNDIWLVVACPNDSLAVWGPEDILGKN
ncbi:hypothetical protein [Bacillus sp. OAE603]|uniref:hypothetical protein n=1 Tax=Gottfriedia sp. OAE603 TaxID=2663872 RepID=UPI0017890901